MTDLRERLEGGVPGVEIATGNSAAAEIYENHLRTEIMLAAQRLNTLAELIGD